VLVNCILTGGDGALTMDDAGIAVHEGVIAAVGSTDEMMREARRERNAEVVDLGGMHVMPGLMNMHVHLGLNLPGAEGLRLREETVADHVLRMAANATAALRAGITTVRLVGEQSHADFALRRAIESGYVEGPTLYTAGQALACTGGHGSGSMRAVEADGPHEFRRAARAQIKEGADLIKVMLTGGIAGEFEAIDTPELARDELAAVVDTAHAWGRPVTAHAGPAASIAAAIELGVDGVEHGYGLNDAVVQLMVQNGTWLVPTLVVTRCEEFFERIGVPRWMSARALSAKKSHSESIRRAFQGGVHIAMGTDMLPAEPLDGTTATIRELEYYVEHGLRPAQALSTATTACAEMLGISDRVGRIAPGQRADLIGLEGDPAQEISALRGMRFVEKGGRIVRHEKPTGVGER
jgi:imidazolonepropionase-like amidohydrolase